VSQEGAFGACRHFLDCLKRGVAAETSGQDNLKSYALVDAAYRAAAEHRAITPAIWNASGRLSTPSKSRRAQ
jgi:predicted dehydrogenase